MCVLQHNLQDAVCHITEGIERINGWEKAGVMARANLTPGSPQVMVITRTPDPEESNTRYAQGGIISRGPEDSAELLAKDLIQYVMCCQRVLAVLPRLQGQPPICCQGQRIQGVPLRQLAERQVDPDGVEQSSGNLCRGRLCRCRQLVGHLPLLFLLHQHLVAFARHRDFVGLLFVHFFDSLMHPERACFPDKQSEV